MAEPGTPSSSQYIECVPSPKLVELPADLPRIEVFNMAQSHEERLEWVKKSCELIFEKLLEIDALLGLPELN